MNVQALSSRVPESAAGRFSHAVGPADPRRLGDGDLQAERGVTCARCSGSNHCSVCFPAYRLESVSSHVAAQIQGMRHTLSSLGAVWLAFQLTDPGSCQTTGSGASRATPQRMGGAFLPGTH
jgi:hypothetical protein